MSKSEPGEGMARRKLSDSGLYAETKIVKYVVHSHRRVAILEGDNECVVATGHRVVRPNYRIVLV